MAGEGAEACTGEVTAPWAGAYAGPSRLLAAVQGRELNLLGLREPDEPCRATLGEGTMTKGDFHLQPVGVWGGRWGPCRGPCSLLPCLSRLGSCHTVLPRVLALDPSSLNERHSTCGWVNKASGHVSPLCGYQGPEA